MKDIPLHNYSRYSNKTVNWVGTDQQTRNVEIRSNPDLYQTWLDSGWNENTCIEYKFNEQGFRTDKFDNSERVAIFGSSQTVGVGLHFTQTWVYQVSHNLNIPIWNLATGTGSLDTCYRIIKYYIDILNIKAVILSIPEDNKFEFWGKPNVPFTINGKIQQNTTLQTICDFWHYNNNNRLINREKNLDAIHGICRQKNIPLITFELGDANKYKPVDLVDWSRCLCHIGPNFHKNIAKFVVDELWPTVNTPWH